MNTAAAALAANVTVATIRTWCRRNVIAAVKVAGRWTIDAASLLHRLTLTKKATPVTEMSTATYSQCGHTHTYEPLTGQTATHTDLTGTCPACVKTQQAEREHAHQLRLATKRESTYAKKSAARTGRRLPGCDCPSGLLGYECTCC